MITKQCAWESTWAKSIYTWYTKSWECLIARDSWTGEDLGKICTEYQYGFCIGIQLHHNSLSSFASTHTYYLITNGTHCLIASVSSSTSCSQLHSIFGICKTQTPTFTLTSGVFNSDPSHQAPQTSYTMLTRLWLRYLQSCLIFSVRTGLSQAHDPNNFFYTPSSAGKALDYADNPVYQIAESISVNFTTNYSWFIIYLYQQTGPNTAKRGPRLESGGACERIPAFSSALLTTEKPESEISIRLQTRSGLVGL